MSTHAAAEPNQDRTRRDIVGFCFLLSTKVLSYVDTLENLQEEGVGD
jgi:hypothetical protein